MNVSNISSSEEMRRVALASICLFKTKVQNTPPELKMTVYPKQHYVIKTSVREVATKILMEQVQRRRSFSSWKDRRTEGLCFGQAKSGALYRKFIQMDTGRGS